MCVCSVHLGHRQAGIVLPLLAALHGAIYFLLSGLWEEPGFENRVSGSGVTRGAALDWVVRSLPACRGWRPHRLSGICQVPEPAGWRVSPCPCCWGACWAQAEVRGSSRVHGAAWPGPSAVTRSSRDRGRRSRAHRCCPRLCRLCGPPLPLSLPSRSAPAGGASLLGAFSSRPREPGTQSAGGLARLLPQGGRWAASAQPSPGLLLLFGDEKAAPRAAPALG